jgi:DNA (cytosine-5)-methyltransferase 1
MRALDLFSGIGGFSLGLERAGFETVAFCEIEDFPRRVLAKHWPGVPIYDDVRTLTAARLVRDGVGRPELICGGFPCQDISLAGRMSGIDGAKSGLWSEYRRLIEEIGPRFVIIENSPVLRSRGLDQMLSELAALGYDAEWHCVPANALGAPHRRDRIWIVAYPAGFGDRLPQGQVCSGRNLSQYGDWWASEPTICRVDDGTAGRVDRLAALGNAVVSQIPEMIGRAIMAAEASRLQVAA